MKFIYDNELQVICIMPINPHVERRDVNRNCATDYTNNFQCIRWRPLRQLPHLTSLVL